LREGKEDQEGSGKGGRDREGQGCCWEGHRFIGEIVEFPWKHIPPPAISQFPPRRFATVSAQLLCAAQNVQITHAQEEKKIPSRCVYKREPGLFLVVPPGPLASGSA
jgi:hypothetical protein